MNNVKFNNEPLETSTISERKRKLQEKAKNKQLAEEKYNLEVQEQQYKRLMHLLTRSKFYASYIVNKIDNSLEKDINKTNKAIKKINSIDENKLPQEKEKKKNRNLKKYISKNVNIIIFLIFFHIIFYFFSDL